LALNANLIDKKDYSLGISMNFGINDTKIDKLDGTEERFFQSNWASTDLKDASDYYLKVGQSVGLIYGYVNDGMYSVDDFNQVTPTTYALKDGVPNDSGVIGVASLRPGYMKIKDVNGDGVINTNDRKVIGNALPKAQGGFGLNGTYKGFDISAYFNWSLGNDVYNTGKIDYNQLYRSTYGNMLNTMNSANRFTYIDTDGSITGVAGGVVTDLVQLGEMNKNKTIWSGSNSFGAATPVVSDWAIEDGSYLRLNNVTIGYTLPMNNFKKSIISNIRLYATGTNLALWTKYSGYDPDVNSNRSDDAFSSLTPGLDYSSYPRSRTYTFGVNVTF
jgi:TonB-dependent starch-binding outer membrane protein SusC